MNLRSLSWTSVSQACASISNLLLSVVVARNSSIVEFGAYGIAFSSYIVSVGVLRAVVGDPVLLRWHEWNQEGRACVTANRKGAASAALLVSLGLAVIMLTASFLVPDELAAALFVMAIALPITLNFDVMRYWSFAEGRARPAALLDASWLLVQIGLFIGLAIIGALQMPLIILTWGLAALLPAFFYGVHRRWRIGAAASCGWLQQNLRLARTYLGEFATYIGVQQSVPYLVVIFSGLAASGSLRSAQTIMGPVNVVTGSANVALIPRARSVYRKKPAQLATFAARVSVILFLFVAVATILIQLVPLQLGELLLGESWATGKTVSLWLAASMAFSGITYGASMGLRVMELSHVSLRIRLIFVPVTITGISCGVIAWGVHGAVAALAASAFVQTFVWWGLFRRFLRQRLH